MGYGGANNPRQIYDGALNGTKKVLNSVKKVETVKRFIYTSSFAAIHHPMSSGYIFTEKDWALQYSILSQFENTCYYYHYQNNLRNQTLSLRGNMASPPWW